MSFSLYVEIGRRIAARRIEKSLTQEQLAELADVGTSHMGRIECGNRRPPLDTLHRIAEVLDLPLWRLLTDNRLSPDEQSWRGRARDLGDVLRELPDTDLELLLGVARRMRAAQAGATLVPTALHPKGPKKRRPKASKPR